MNRSGALSDIVQESERMAQKDGTGSALLYVGSLGVGINLVALAKGLDEKFQ